MTKVLQYGEGNFLRTFVDVYFDTLNKNGQGLTKSEHFEKTNERATIRTYPGDGLPVLDC